MPDPLLSPFPSPFSLFRRLFNTFLLLQKIHHPPLTPILRPCRGVQVPQPEHPLPQVKQPPHIRRPFPFPQINTPCSHKEQEAGKLVERRSPFAGLLERFPTPHPPVP